MSLPVKEIHSELLRDSYYEIEHPSGLTILVMPKEGYSSAYALFGTKYGSIDTRFKRSDEADFIEVPEGIAHFLEHKLFESEDLDAFARYAKTGASANAYTSFERTCYLFSCAGNFKASLEILLDFVQSPYFTEQTVQKEQGIIGQEIRMYQDEPNWQVMFNCLRALYQVHPVRIDIAGTIDSISQITADLLYRCYHTFYNLNNMALAVAGNVTVDEVLEVADRILKKAPELAIERNFPDEPAEVVQPYIEEKLDVAAPLFMLGFKETYDTPERPLREQLQTNILLEMLAGNTSPLYRRLFDEGLINTQFGAEYFQGYGFASVLFSGESKDPQKVADAIQAEIERVRREGLDPAAFERARRKLYGRFVMAFNDIEELANEMIAAEFRGGSLFDEAQLLREIALDEITARLETTLRREYSALSVVKA
uniref:EF-P 5-aminopentanol modification-associated protein YfmH n=1 Tax=Candidatus Fimivicinus sp. TaxID=3056640 RepID=UPI003FEDCA6D